MCQEAALAGHEDVWPGLGTMEFPGFFTTRLGLNPVVHDERRRMQHF